jgi:hypothetical protein
MSALAVVPSQALWRRLPLGVSRKTLIRIPQRQFDGSERNSSNNDSKKRMSKNVGILAMEVYTPSLLCLAS